MCQSWAHTSCSCVHCPTRRGFSWCYQQFSYWASAKLCIIICTGQYEYMGLTPSWVHKRFTDSKALFACYSNDCYDNLRDMGSLTRTTLDRMMAHLFGQLDVLKLRPSLKLKSMTQATSSRRERKKVCMYISLGWRQRIWQIKGNARNVRKCFWPFQHLNLNLTNYISNWATKFFSVFHPRIC